MLELETQKDGESTHVILRGALAGTDVEKQTAEVFKLIDDCKPNEVLYVDLSQLESIDTIGSGFLSAMMRRSKSAGKKIEFSQPNDEVALVLSRFLWLDTPKSRVKGVGDWFESVGASAIAKKNRSMQFLQLVADTVYWSIGGARRTSRVRRGAVWDEAVSIGLDALGIVCLISFLIGTVVALQTASLLRLFGADILVADMIAISMVRELAPLMTTIIMAGRSGASIAAEIATMTINEEIAGIRTMGLEPVKYIVVPKFRAITLTMPGLTIFATCSGIFGGFLIAVFYMGLSPAAFMHEMSQALFIKDILVSQLKAIVFAWIIIWISAHQGFSAYGGSESVGRVTTTSVVLSIFWCIIADAAFSMLFYF